MSEYQYYEFRAIDRPLDHAAQAALRRISSRGVITAYSFVNTYEWGDFRGDPQQLMERWFDLFIYWANWGTRTLMLRLPRRYLDPAVVKPYVVEDAVEAWTAGDHTVIRLNRGDEDPRDEYVDDDSDLAASFGALRAEVLHGDRRIFYLAWLVGVMEGGVDDGLPEPPRPPGLISLSEPLKAFAAFFELDQDLLDAAAEGDSGTSQAIVEPSAEELETFIDSLKPKELATLLRRAAIENDPHVRLDLCRLWAQARGGPLSTPAEAPSLRRTVRDLRARADAIADERRGGRGAPAAAQRQRREEQARREREERLDKLAPRVEAAWREIEDLVSSKLPKPYDDAVAILKDLAALADRDGSRPAFDRRLDELRDRHQRKRTFLARLDTTRLKSGPLSETSV